MIHNVLEAGCDEAGRGPLAGSVFAAAVVLDPDRVTQVPEFAWLNDSKQLTDKQRYLLRPVIEREAISWAVVEVTAKEIDERNILQCSILGMQRALDQLTVRPQHILVDGNKWKPYVPEGEVLEIDYMLRLHSEYPQYGWDRNKGYPTAEHYAALKQYGPTPYHRMTFNLKITKSEITNKKLEQ